MKIQVVKLLCSVSKLSTESVGSRRELVMNSVHTTDADADAMRQLSRVGGVYWISGNKEARVSSVLM